MKHFLKILLLLALVSPALRAQTTPDRATLSGYVKDAADGEGLIGVSVYVKERATGAVTNNYGFYSLTLPRGSYTLVFTFIGYQKITRTLELTADQNLSLELREEGRDLAEVVVKSQREDDNVRAIEMSVNKVDIKTIRKMPALLGEVDIVRSLQLLPGVSTVGEGASGFNVRGGDVSQNLILLDEAPVYNASHLFGFFSVFNPDAVKDVKLIKGGIPAQYGGRISSILDVRMKEGNAKKAELNAGIGAIFSRVAYERPVFRGKGSFIVAARRSYVDVLAKPFLTGSNAGAVFYFYDLTAKANYRLDASNTFFLSGYFGRDVFGSSDFGFDWGNGTVSGRWNHVFNNRLFLNLTSYYSNYKYGLGNKTKDPNAKDSFNWNSKIVSYSVKPDFTFFLTPENQLSFGGQYINYDSQPGSATARSSGESRDISLESRYGDESALYVANEQKIGTRLTLQYGLRYSLFRALGPGLLYDYQSVNPGERAEPIFPGTPYKSGETIQQYSNWEPRFSANINLNPAASLKLSYNRTTQYLHLLSNTAASSPLDVWTLSSKNIRPQLADQVALGWFQNFNDNAIEFSVETYYKDLKNQIDYVRGSDLLLNQYVEGDLLRGPGRAYGAEFYVKKNKGRLTGWVSYTLARTERQVEGINGGKWFPARFDKTHNLSAVALFDLTEKWSLSANFALSSGTPATYPTNRFEWGGIAIAQNVDDARNNNRVPAYHRLDLSATKRVNHGPFSKRGSAEWVFSIYNAYNRRNPFSVYTRQNADDPRQTEAIRYAVLGTIVPAVTYNFKF